MLCSIFVHNAHPSPCLGIRHLTHLEQKRAKKNQWKNRNASLALSEYADKQFGSRHHSPPSWQGIPSKMFFAIEEGTLCFPHYFSNLCLPVAMVVGLLHNRAFEQSPKGSSASTFFMSRNCNQFVLQVIHGSYLF